MGAVGLAVIDPHFVRESNIEDCVIEAVGQVRSRSEFSNIFFLTRLSGTNAQGIEVFKLYRVL